MEFYRFEHGVSEIVALALPHVASALKKKNKHIQMRTSQEKQISFERTSTYSFFFLLKALSLDARGALFITWRTD